MQYLSSGPFEQRKSAPGKPVLEHCVGTQHQISRAPLRFPSARRSHSTLTSDWHASDVWKGAKAHRACSRHLQIEERRLETHRFKSYKTVNSTKTTTRNTGPRLATKFQATTTVFESETLSSVAPTSPTVIDIDADSLTDSMDPNDLEDTEELDMSEVGTMDGEGTEMLKRVGQ